MTSGQTDGSQWGWQPGHLSGAYTLGELGYGGQEDSQILV